jgi:hypothetical protein
MHEIANCNCALVYTHSWTYSMLLRGLGRLSSRAEASQTPATLSNQDIAIRVLAELVSVYSERAENEALITARSLAQGQESCKSYPR